MEKIKCPLCKGTGLDQCSWCNGKGTYNGEKCPKCDGKGITKCYFCDGKGVVDKD